MLLSCCFRDPSKKKHKKRRSGTSHGHHGEELSPPCTEDVTSLLPSLPSPNKEDQVQVFTVSSTKRVSPQERHPREIRKLRKQRSEENVKAPVSISSVEGEVESETVPGLPSPPHTPPPTATKDHGHPSHPTLLPVSFINNIATTNKNNNNTSTGSPDSTLSNDYHRITLTHNTIKTETLPVTSVTRVSTTNTDCVSTTITDPVVQTRTVERVGTVHTRTTTDRQDRTGLWRSRDLPWNYSQSSRHQETGETQNLGSIKKSTGFHDGSLLRDRLQEEERRNTIEKRKDGEDIITRILQEKIRREEEERRKKLESRTREEDGKNRNEVETKKEENLLEEENENDGISERKRERKKEAEYSREDSVVQRLEAEYERKLEGVRSQYREEREAAESRMKSHLAAEVEKHRKELEKAVMEAKNEANRTISQLNKQVVTERSKLVAEQQANTRQLEEEWRMKEERMEQWVAEVSERERSWQEERGEVLAEVQRLKAEAGRMVAILAMEAEEENYSQEKKLSLGQEVYSLQLVVEMRTGEVRELRQKLAQAEHQLEVLDETRVKLSKATARLDDLQAQVAAKDKLEKQLSIEKSQLEMTVTSSNKAVERMSQNVEELQWRIRNNRDVNPACVRDSQPSSLPACLPESPATMRFRPSLPDIPRNNILLSFVNKEMLPGSTDEGREGETSDFDFSPLTPSGQRVSVGSSSVASILKEKTEKSEEDNRHRENRPRADDGDSCSLDEGLGDLSEGEQVDCPLKEVKEVLEKESKEIDDLEQFTDKEKEYKLFETLDAEEIIICEEEFDKIVTFENVSEQFTTLEKESEKQFPKFDTTVTKDSKFEKESEKLASFEKASEEITTLEKVATTLEKVATTFVEKSEDSPPLPEADPPNTRNITLEEKMRRPSRIPKMIQSVGPVNLVNNQELVREKDDDENVSKDTNQNNKEERDRAFSPERRPSRISFETPL